MITSVVMGAIQKALDEAALLAKDAQSAAISKAAQQMNKTGEATDKQTGTPSSSAVAATKRRKAIISHSSTLLFLCIHVSAVAFCFANLEGVSAVDAVGHMGISPFSSSCSGGLGQV